jgi:hypothetical protein
MLRDTGALAILVGMAAIAELGLGLRFGLRHVLLSDQDAIKRNRIMI